MIYSTLCYLERGDSYLMLHRVKKEHDANQDKWIGVGGKFEEGEKPGRMHPAGDLGGDGADTDQLPVPGMVTFVSDQWPAEYMHLFTADGWTGTPHPCDEGELAWIRKSDLQSLPLWEGDRIFLRLLEENAPFFSLKLCYQGEHLVRADLNGTQIL